MFQYPLPDGLLSREISLVYGYQILTAGCCLNSEFVPQYLFSTAVYAIQRYTVETLGLIEQEEYLQKLPLNQQ